MSIDPWAIIASVTISVLTVAVEHLINWCMVINKKRLPRLWAYVAGTLAMYVPMTVIFYLAGEREVIAVMWLTAGACGLTIFILYEWERRWTAETQLKIEKEVGKLKDSQHGEAD